jgi:glycosyltransferase involved in cell wall biosynthesis
VDILQLTPGAGTMYCGNCLRDNALVGALRTLGHQLLMVPLYLPLTLDESDQSAGTPVFFSGINVYLDQELSWFRNAPGWLHQLLGRPSLLKWAARQSAKTQARSLGPITLSMLRGEAGNQARELNDLLNWLKTQPAPDVILLSNALLLGMARKLKAGLNRPLVCMLQGEDYFLDSLPEPHRTHCWQTLADRAHDADLLIAPSHYFAELMRKRMGLSQDKVKVVYNGLNLEGFLNPASQVASERSAATVQASPEMTPRPVLGYLARMCPEKGLDTLVDAFIELRRRGRVPGLQLCVVGSLGPSDSAFVSGLRDRLAKAELRNEARFHPNVDRTTKLQQLHSFTIFSVPALYGEAFGLYLLEALAAGVPVVQPRTAAFTEIIEQTGGGVLCEPGSVEDLSDSIERLLLDPVRARALGVAGQRAVFERFSAEAMARQVAETVETVCRQPSRKLA